MRRSFVLVLLFAGMMAVEVPAEAGGLAYVLSNSSNLLTIFDLTTKTAPRSLATGSQPATLLIHPNNRLAFVSNSADNTVTFYGLSPGQEQVLRTVSTDSVPGDLALSQDGKTLYVANEGSNDVTVIDVISHSVVATIPVDLTPVALNVSPDGRTVYAVNTDSATVSLIDTATHTVRGTLMVGSKPNQFAISPDLRFGYVVNTSSNNITQIDLTSNTVMQTIPVGTNPVSIAFSPDSSTLYVINQGSNDIWVVQLQPVLRLVQKIPVGNAPVALALTSDGSFGFLTNSGSDTVSVIDFRADSVVDTVSLPTGSKPFAITLDPNEDFVYVTNLGSNTVDVINASTDQLLSQPAVGQAPTQFSFLNAPSLVALQPSSGLAGGTIVIQGEGFVPDSTALFVTSTATSTATSGFLDHDILRATVPPQLGIGTVNVLVENPDLSTTDRMSFTVVAAPVIASGGVTPSQGPPAGGLTVTVAGSGFQNGALVSFGGRLGIVLAQGSTSLTVTTPPGPPGLVDVAVVNPDGTRAVLSGGFTYVAQPGSLLQLTDTSVLFVARSGEARPLSQSLGVMNFGSDTLSWTASVALTSAAPTNWLSVNPTSGGAPQTMVVRADPTGLPAGVFTGNITVTAATSQVIVSVTLTILATTSTDLVLSQVADGGGLFITTLIFINPNDADAHATVLFRDDDGTPLRLNFTDGESGSQLNLTVPARGARFLISDGSSSILTVGSAEVISDLPLGGTAIFRQHVSGRPDFEAAVALVAPAPKLVLSADDAAGFASGLAVMNTNDQVKTIQLRIRDASGPLLGQILRDVPARGHFSKILSELLPTVVGHRTTIEITTTDGSPIAAVGIRANLSPTGSGALTTLPVMDPFAPAAQSFLAHVIDGTQNVAWRTSFLVFNPANFSVNTTMDFFNDPGTGFVLGFTNCPTTCSTGPSFTFAISPLGLLALQTNAVNTTNEWGQGRVRSDLPVAGTAIFLQQVSGRPDFEAAVPLAQPASDVFLAVDNSAGFSTGIAIGNATAQAVTLTLIFRDETGAVITSQPPVQLAANGHAAFILTDLMPAAAQRRGVLEIITPTGMPVSAITIRGNDTGALTTLPVLTR